MTDQAKITAPQALDPQDLARATGGSFTDRFGTEGGDHIATGDGMDKVFGAGGNDTISSGGGQDEVHAGAGDDFVDAGAGDDKVFGGEGNDLILGGEGTDELHGGDGHDHLRGGAGHGDKVFGGEGSDTFWWQAGDGNDELHGGNGADNIMLQGVTMEQLQAGLQMFDSSSYTISGNAIVFHGPANGQFVVNGEVVKFFDMEQITIAG
jgi:Ca2+-binding RTX toxin-like protein